LTPLTAAPPIEFRQRVQCLIGGAAQDIVRDNDAVAAADGVENAYIRLAAATCAETLIIHGFFQAVLGKYRCRAMQGRTASGRKAPKRDWLTLQPMPSFPFALPDRSA
jgi:hypothetical protein